jgi:phytanoyl-CoA hydroxylase
MKTWNEISSEMPWYDRRDAHEILSRRSGLSEFQIQLLGKWVDDGYIILKDTVDVDLIDRMVADLDALWDAETSFNELQIEEVRITPDASPGVSHKDLLSLAPERRRQLRDHSTWRVHGFNRFSSASQAIFESEAIKNWCSMVFGEQALPQYTINFMYGSRQELHQDTCVFHVHPKNYLIGAWLACEDIHPDSGPLIYYPGSHKEPLYPKFDNYPQTNLRTCNPSETTVYYDWLKRISGKYQKEQYIARKGDILLWHGQLIHGGDTVVNPALSRKSYVCHYIPEGRNKHHEVTGPFNW